MKKYNLIAAIVLTIFTFQTFGRAAEAAPGFFPLGVYWPGEYSFHELPKEERFKKIEAIFSTLEKEQVNTVWVTHMDASFMAEFSRRAQKHQLRLIAVPDEIIPRADLTEKEFPAVFDKVLKDWGNAPKPIAWSFGDEPAATLMDGVNRFAAIAKQKGELTTTITTTVDVRFAGKVLKNLEYLGIDFYPFFSENNANGVAGGFAGQIQYYKHNMKVLGEEGRRLGKNYWMMAQGSQEAWGPSKLDEKGNVIYLPGGGPHFIAPSAPQIEWQAWVALAEGSRGLFYYSLFLGNYTKAVPPVMADGKTYAYTVETNSENPPGFLYPDGSTTPQMVAIGKVFKQVKACSEILLKMKKSTAPFACPGTHMPLLADHLECFEGAKGERYLIVVNGDFSRRVDYPVFIDAEIASQYKMALDVKNNLPMKFSDRNPDGKAVHEPYKMIKVELGPGEGTLIQLK